MLNALIKSFSVFGLFVGFLFLCASLTPSLLPRLPLTQGALAGVAFAVGYGTGKGLYFLWDWLGGPVFSDNNQRIVNWVLSGIGVVIAIFPFSRIATWQNSIRSLMEMESVETGYPWMVAGIALLVALLLIFAGREIIWLGRKFAAMLGRVLPRNLAIGVGGLLAVLLVFTLVNDFVVQKALRFADTMFAGSDQRTNDGTTPPTHAFASGGPSSVID